jgi:hypothetical protein
MLVIPTPAEFEPLTLLMPIAQHWLAVALTSMKLQQKSSPSGIGLGSESDNIKALICEPVTEVCTLLPVAEFGQHAAWRPLASSAVAQLSSQVRSICTPAIWPAPPESERQMSADVPGAAEVEPTRIAAAPAQDGAAKCTATAASAAHAIS